MAVAPGAAGIFEFRLIFGSISFILERSSRKMNEGMEVQMTLKRVGPGSCAKVFGLLYAVAGLIFGLVASAISIVGSAAGEGASGVAGALFGVGAIVALPVLYGILGAVSGGVGAFLYNLIAGRIGGIEMDLS